MSSGVPLIIGGTTSKTAQILSRVLAPLSVPLVSSLQLTVLLMMILFCFLKSLALKMSTMIHTYSMFYIQKSK